MGQKTLDQHANAAPGDGFDALEVPLGDLLRGERATLGKSLLDVERDLKIKAVYIAAIENSDLSAFTTQGFVAGYVRSYARYLGLDPEWTFARFTAESGFSGVHGLSAKQAKAAKRAVGDVPGRMDPNDVISSARVSFAPKRDTMFSHVEPGALGSALVLLALLAAIGYGGWSVLQDIQRVQFAPVDQTPETLATLDPLAGARDGALMAEAPGGLDTAISRGDSLDRLYRPHALEVPVMTPRDQAIATLNPNDVGQFSPPIVGLASASLPEEAAGPVPAAAAVQVTELAADEVILFAVRPSWIRVSAASGTVIYEGTLNAGDSFTLPQTAEAPTLRAGNSGSLFFAVNGVTLGPAGPGTSVARDVVLSADALSDGYAMADARTDPDLPRVASLILSGEPASE